MKIPFRMIQDKISWLNKNIEKDQLVLLESGLARIVEELEENTMRANSSFARVLSLDLLYCFVRHKRWLQVTTFSELLETDVSSSFDLPGKASRSLVKKMKLLCEQILPQKGTVENNLDSNQFIIYLAKKYLKTKNYHILLQDDFL